MLSVHRAVHGSGTGDSVVAFSPDARGGTWRAHARRGAPASRIDAGTSMGGGDERASRRAHAGRTRRALRKKTKTRGPVERALSAVWATRRVVQGPVGGDLVAIAASAPSTGPAPVTASSRCLGLREKTQGAVSPAGRRRVRFSKRSARRARSPHVVLPIRRCALVRSGRTRRRGPDRQCTCTSARSRGTPPRRTEAGPRTLRESACRDRDPRRGSSDLLRSLPDRRRWARTRTRACQVGRSPRRSSRIHSTRGRGRA